MDQLIGILWIASSLLAGVIHYRAKGRILQAMFAAFCAFAVQFALMFVVLAFIYAAHGGSLLVTSRSAFQQDWTGVSFAGSIVIFWAWLWHRAKSPEPTK